MASRLVLGCGSVGRQLAVAESSRTHVVTEDEHRVETLRADGIAATLGDPADPATVAAVSFEPDTVVVGSDDPAQNCTIAAFAADAFPEARLFAFTGQEPTDAQRERLHRLADDVHDPADALSSFMLDRVGDDGLQTRRLMRVLRTAEPPLAVFAHDNPDPDAIASALALVRIAERAGLEAEACYFGDISHQENRALVNLLDLELQTFSSDEALPEFGSVALVDHSRPGINDQLPPETDIDIVVDHHPPRAPVEASFVDLRSNVGSTSTLFADYLRRLGIDPTPELATALLFGIQVDTDDFSREVAEEDFDAAAYLVSFVDAAKLERIESPSVSVETVEILASAISNRDVRDGVLASYVGAISDRDALAQAADQLLTMDGVSTTLVFGTIDDTVFASARARGSELDLGEALREAFDQIGSAGGHADMAGAQIPVGGLGAEDETDTAIRDVISERFFETVGVGTNTAPAAVYAKDTHLGLAEALPDHDDNDDAA
ncbi:DHH family phosphoesterase [Halosegnis longus]|uniref:Bifunctional oligoribonuclease/PAP phosphatase NrnA n=1 Tax=Halosegnis longus TaxID=2216012 RepID=A0AAJ4R9V4_9EURY|nr:MULTISPECIES: DHH family phosphoesterase [Halobacteriales]RNJ26875.1 bifunctional oligoribonuclease/PAP phosphatase NrnA [Salella cibi]